MKSLNTYWPKFLSLLILTALAGCGGQNQATKLEVTHAFAMTNPSFGGGLIISGRNLTTGEYFSQGLTNSMSFQQSLSLGNWQFTAIGWDGGGTASGTEKNFAGKPYCAFATQKLDGTTSTATVNLTVSQATCADPVFASSFGADTLGPTPTLKKMYAFITCNSLFDSLPAATDSVASKIVSSSTADGYCVASNTSVTTFPKDWESRAKSIRIHALNKPLGQNNPTIGFMSQCIQGETSNPSIVNPSSTAVPNSPNPFGANYDLRLPLTGVPLIITLFREADCSKPIARYDFENGLLPKDPRFDHRLVNKSSSAVRMFLPSNDMRRGYSPFAHLLPEIRPSAYSSFNTYPSALTKSFHFKPGSNNEVFLWGSTCGTTSGIVSCTSLTNGTLKVVVSPGSSGAGSFSVNGSTYSYFAESTYGTYDINQSLVRLLGNNSMSEKARTFFDIKDEEETRGVLGKIRNMFSADGAGGGLGIEEVTNTTTFGDLCNSLVNPGKIISIFDNEKMAFQTFKVSVSNLGTTSSNSYICSDSYSTCNNVIDKRMLIWDYQQDLINPQVAIDFSCTKFVGTWNSSDSRSDANGSQQSKRTVNWNTTTASSYANQRFEVFESFIRKDANGVKTEESRRIATVRKFSADKLDVRTFAYNAQKNGTSWSENLTKTEQAIISSSDVCYLSFTPLAVGSAAYGSIFSTYSTAAAVTSSTTGSYNSGYLVTGDLPYSVPASCSSMNILVPVAGSVTNALSSLNPASSTFTNAIAPDVIPGY